MSIILIEYPPSVLAIILLINTIHQVDQINSNNSRMEYYNGKYPLEYILINRMVVDQLLRRILFDQD